MTLPTGTISMSQVNLELGYSSTATISLNNSDVRTLAGVPSGTISMSNLQGKSNQFAFTISSNQTNANLRTLAVNAGWNQSSKVAATIASGVLLGSNSTGTPGLTINGSFPGGVTLVNNGSIYGMGGNGGQGNFTTTNGASGGTALSASVAVTITNNGTIGGGGGGGGAGGGASDNYYWYGGGGGGGGQSYSSNSSGGVAGGETWIISSARSISGSAGSSAGPGAGGRGHRAGGSNGSGGTGGTGGSWGAAGASGAANTGAYYPSTASPARSGGSGGAAVSGNANITWLATGTRLGNIA